MASECKNDDGPKPEPVTNTSSVNNKENNEKKKLVDGSHGLRFESKLLTLFCIRALATGYKFELSKEKEEEGKESVSSHIYYWYLLKIEFLFDTCIA